MVVVFGMQRTLTGRSVEHTQLRVACGYAPEAWGRVASGYQAEVFKSVAKGYTQFGSCGQPRTNNQRTPFHVPTKT